MTRAEKLADRDAFLARGRALTRLLGERPKVVGELERHARRTNQRSADLAIASLSADGGVSYLRYERDVAGPAELAASETAMTGMHSCAIARLRDATRVHVASARQRGAWSVAGGGAQVEHAFRQWAAAWAAAERRVADAHMRIAQADRELTALRQANRVTSSAAAP